MKVKKKLEKLLIRPVRGKYKPLSESDIDKIEKKYKTRLSEDFKTLVGEFGVSRFSGMMSIKSGNNEYPLSVILGGGKGSYSISEYIEVYEDRLPEGLLSFAEDEFGNLFCIGLSKMTNGKIYYWHHEDPTNFSNDSEGNPVLIENSLDEFIDHMTLFPYEDE